MPHLVLAGAPTGCWTNLGDEAILRGMVDALRGSIEDVRFTVISSSPAETYEPYDCASVRFNDLAAVASTVSSADALLLGGGSIFFDYWGCDASAVLTPRHQGVSLWTGLALLAAADRIPVMTYAVGVNPLATADGLLMTKATLQLATAITVRDAASRDLMEEWGFANEAVIVTGDPAIGIDLTDSVGDRRSVLRPGPRLGVALREWDVGADPDAWFSSVASAVDAHLEVSGGSAVFIACHKAVRWPQTDDGSVAEKVIERMRFADRATVLAAETPWEERAAVLTRCDAVLAMRYHAALLAMRAGVPVVGISYDAKVRSLFVDWGVADVCIDVTEVVTQANKLVDLLRAGAQPASAEPVGTTSRERTARLARERRTSAVAADTLSTGVGVRNETEAVAQLLTRMQDNSGERPAVINEALTRLAEQIPADLPAKKTVAILTNRLLDRKTAQVRVGGAERYGLALARLLRDIGLEPSFFQGGGEFGVGDFFGFPVHPIPFGKAISEFQVGVGEEFYRRTADADHVVYLMPNYASGPIREDAVVISHGVWWDHELWPHLEFRSPEWLAQLEAVFTRPRRVISVDANTGNVVRALFPSADSIVRHIPSAVDTDAFHVSRKRTERLTATDPVVLFPRRAETIRGSHLVGPIMQLVPDPCRFVWVGQGDAQQVAGLRQIAERDSRLRIASAGFDAMPAQYAAADICVIPTMASEGQSLACLEAMASGLPVVVTRVGGLPELVTHGVDGLICDPTAESLAAAVRRLVRDPGLRERLGRAARSTALRHSEESWRAAWVRELQALGWVDDGAAAKAVPYDIVKLSIINNEQRYQRPQQFATHWGRRGRRVFYVRVSGHLPPGGKPIEVSRLGPGVFDVRLALPNGVSLHQGVLPPGTVSAATAALSTLRSEWNIQRAVTIVELGMWHSIAVAAREAFGWPIHYDCMDDWSTFPGSSERPKLLAAENALVRECDTMSVSSRALQRRWAAERPDAALVRNAADFRYFHDMTSGDNECPASIAQISGPVAGFIGAIVEWFDVGLMEAVARRRPDVSFVLVGNVARVSVEVLKELPNVYFVGQQPYGDMPKYVHRFDACLVPFIANEVTESMDLVKVYEYLAQGKPIVCTPVAEMVPYRDYLYLADGADEFVARLDTALAETDRDARERRIAMARMNSWDDRIDEIEGLLLSSVVSSNRTDRQGSPREFASTHPGNGSGPSRSEVIALQAKLDKLNQTKAVRAMRRYWKVRQRIEGVRARMTVKVHK